MSWQDDPIIADPASTNSSQISTAPPSAPASWQNGPIFQEPAMPVAPGTTSSGAELHNDYSSIRREVAWSVREPWESDPIIHENYPSEIPPPEVMDPQATSPDPLQRGLYESQLNQQRMMDQAAPYDPQAALAQGQQQLAARVAQRSAAEEAGRQQRVAADFQQQQAQRWLEGMPQIDVGLPEQQAAQYAARSQYLTHQPPAIDQLNPTQQQDIARQFGEQYQQGAPLGVDTLTNIGQKVARVPSRINQGLNFLDELMGGGQTPEQNQQDREILDRYGSPPATSGAKVVETAAGIVPIAAASAVGGPGAGAAVALADVGSQVEDAAKRALIAQGKDPDDPKNLALLKGAIQGAYSAATMFIGGGGGNGLAQVGKQAAIGSAIEAGSQLGGFIEGRKPDLEAILYSGATMGALHALFHPIETVRGGIDAVKAGREQLRGQPQPRGIDWNNPQERADSLKEIEAQLPKGEPNAREIQSPAQMGEQPRGPQSLGSGGGEGVERGQPAPPVTGEGEQARIEEQRRAAQEQAPPQQPAKAGQEQGSLYENVPRVEGRQIKVYRGGTPNVPGQFGSTYYAEDPSYAKHFTDEPGRELIEKNIQPRRPLNLQNPTDARIVADAIASTERRPEQETIDLAQMLQESGMSYIPPKARQQLVDQGYDYITSDRDLGAGTASGRIWIELGNLQPTEPAPANQHEISPEQRSANDEGQGASDGVIPETPPHEGNVPAIKVGDLITWTDPADRTSTLSGKVLKATDRAFVVDRGDGHSQFIRAEKVIAHTPQEPAPYTGRGPKGYTRAEVEQKLLDHLQETGGIQDSAEQSDLDKAASGDAFSFRDQLPEEVKTFLEGRPNLRRFVKVAKPGEPGYANAGGMDALSQLGEDNYFAHLERRAGNNLPQAIDAAENSQDPQMQFLAAFYKHIQPGGERKPQQLVKPDNLATGTELEIHGEKFRIIDTGEGWRALKDGKEYPIVPVEAIDKIPVDKGSIKMGKEADLEREPFKPGEELGFGQGRGRGTSPTPAEPNQPRESQPKQPRTALKESLYGERSFIGQDVIPTALDAAKGLREAADDVRKVFAPQTRGEQAKQTQGIIREMGAKLAQRTDRAEAALHEASKLFDARSREANLRYMDNIENGRPQGEPQTETISRLMRELLDGRRNEVRALGTGKLEHFIEDYFPHIWKDPEKAAQIFGGKRPMEGPKSFLKKRTIPTIAEGVKFGLEPISDNPVDLVLLKVREMDRYILSQQALAEMKTKNLVQFVPAMEQGPQGYAKIDDRIAKVYGPPHLKVEEHVDRAIYDALSQTAKNLGISHNRVMNAGRNRLGFSVTGESHVVSQFGTGISVLAHEIGHQLDEKFGMFDRFFNHPDDNVRPMLKKEMRAIADLTERGKNARKREEQLAQIVEAYVHARDRMQEVAPYTTWEFEKMIHDHPELQPLMERPSLGLKRLENKLPHHGLLLMGEYQAPEEVARLLNNYLSPGIRQHSGVFRALMTVGNVLNQAELGLSAFHLGFTSNDAVTSKASLAIEQAVHGNIPAAAKSALEAGVAQVTTFLKGRKLRAEWMKPGSQGEEIGQIVDAMVAAGGRAQQDPLYKTQFGRNMMKAMRSGNIVGAALRLPLAINEVPGRFLLEYIVPRQKLGVFYDMARMELEKLGPGATRDKVREVLGKAWDSVDNRMGQIVYDNLFWNKTAKELAMVTVRSVGWNLGTVREGAGAAIDTAKAVGQLARGQKPEFTRRMAYAVALPLVTAMTGALYQYMRTGEPPKDTKDLFFPRTGEIDATGHEIRTALPTYMKDIFHAVEEPRKTLTNKLHPLIGMIADMLQNEDYYGTQIRNPDDPIMKQITDELKYVGEQFVPFSIRGLQKANENPNTKTIDKVLPFIGINQAPQYISLSSAEKMAEDLASEKFPRGSRTRAEADRALQKAKLVKEERSGVPEAQDHVRDAIEGGQMNAMDAKSIYRRSHESPLLYHVKQLAADDAMRVWRVATDAEKKDMRPIIMGKIARSQRLPAEQRTAMMRELGAANLAGVPSN